MNFPLIANVVVFAVLLFALGQTRHKQWSLARKVLVGLATGVVFGLALQLIYGSDSQVLKDSIQWFNIVGNGYVQLLQMIVMPLVFASILSAVARLHNASQLGKISFLSIGTLLFTTLIAALVGVLVTNMFGLTAEGLVQGSAETARLNAIQSNYVGKVADLSVPQLILSFVPKNPFADLTGANPTSIISIVIFSAFLGVAALKLLKEDVEKGQRVLTAIDTLQGWVMKLVRLVMQLTPYGVLALMTKVVAGSNLQDIIKLGGFVVASYIALGIMFVVHGLLLAINGVSPLKYFRKVWPVITFAFTSRSSAASIPLNVEAQTRRLGDCQLLRLLWCHHRPERLRRYLSGNVGGDGRADRGHQPAGSDVDCHPRGHRHRQLGGRRRGGRRRDLRRADRPAGDGPAGDPGSPAHLRRTADRYGAYRAER